MSRFVYQTHAEKIRAYRQRKKQPLPSPPLPPGPYRVIYADPLWYYRSTDPYLGSRATDHYATLSIAELCALPVRKVVAPKAVLFLWVTSAVLEECFPVIRAWGFTYKASTVFIWNKERGNYGYYVSTQHELLLVCTRGSCKPDIQTRYPSVHHIPRSEHSSKPQEFRLLIEDLYRDGRRLELFARERVAGWEAWGHGVDHLLSEPAMAEAAD